MTGSPLASFKLVWRASIARILGGEHHRASIARIFFSTEIGGIEWLTTSTAELLVHQRLYQWLQSRVVYHTSYAFGCFPLLIFSRSLVVFFGLPCFVCCVYCFFFTDTRGIFFGLPCFVFLFVLTVNGNHLPSLAERRTCLAEIIEPFSEAQRRSSQSPSITSHWNQTHGVSEARSLKLDKWLQNNTCPAISMVWHGMVWRGMVWNGMVSQFWAFQPPI